MNRKLCAPADRARSWESIDWKKAEAYVKKLQMRMIRSFIDGYAQFTRLPMVDFGTPLFI